MSRIHEALTKAGFEVGAPAAGAEAPPPQLERQLETTVSNDEDLLTLTEVPVPRVPENPPDGTPLPAADINQSCTQAIWNPDRFANVFAYPLDNAEAAEQYRTLRSRLYRLRTENPLRVNLITSSLAGDGKTLTASNLAHAIVRQPGQRALLIDADLRSPRLHVILGTAAEPGLSDYLSGQADEMTVIQHGEVEGLYLISGGKSLTHASELLSNGRLKKLIDRTTAWFDWVIIDSPPCVPVADATVIAQFCDATLLVVRAGSTPLSAVRKACQELQNKKLIGVVLNAVDEQALTYSSYYERRVYGEVNAEDSTLRLPLRGKNA